MQSVEERSWSQPGHGTARAYAWLEMSTGAPKKTRVAAAARGVTWMSLVAATTLGVGHIDELHARVRASDVLQGDGELRLIIQSYAKHALSGAGLPAEYAMPLASTQRAITPEELEQGVDVSFFQPGAEGREVVLVAWVEQGAATLDLDALEARPTLGSFYGVAPASGELVLRQKRA